MKSNWKSNIKEKAKRFFWHGYWTDPAIFFSLALAVIANLGLWTAIFAIVEPTDRQIILHYNIYFGVDAIGDWRNIFAIPILSAIILVTNTVLSRFFYFKERMAAYLFAAMALLIQLLAAVGLGSIILINF